MANKTSTKTTKTQIEDTKLKPLQPTLRQKKRFIRAVVTSKNKIDFKTISENLIEEIISYMGTVEMGKAGVWVLRDKFDFDKQEIIIKCSTKSYDKLIGILSLVLFLGNNNPCKIDVKRVSGTLKGVYVE
jgi:RNase P/RNase MRP subunit POP5